METMPRGYIHASGSKRLHLGSLVVSVLKVASWHETQSTIEADRNFIIFGHKCNFDLMMVPGEKFMEDQNNYHPT